MQCVLLWLLANNHAPLHFYHTDCATKELLQRQMCRSKKHQTQSADVLQDDFNFNKKEKLLNYIFGGIIP